MTPSAYWTEELGNIDYLADASPLIVAKLRHHAFHITGLRPYDYRAQGDEKSALFEQRLRTLVAMGGEELVVPEHPALGGFGYEIDGRVFNLDTLKFLEVLVGMKRAGALDAFRRVKGRRIGYFFTNQELTPAINKFQVKQDGNFPTHKSIRLKGDAKPMPTVVNQLVKPTNFAKPFSGKGSKRG